MLVPSNKPHKPEKKLIIADPKLIGPLIDKISVCLPINDPNEKDDLITNINQRIFDHDPAVSPVKNKGGYKTAAKFHFSDGNDGYHSEHILVQCHPYNSKAPFVRLEWNPHFVRKCGLNALKETFCDILLHGIEQLYYGGYVTRLDVSVDVAGVRVEDIVCTSKRKRTQNIYVGTDGRIETIYLGKSTSNQVVIYDRIKLLEKCDEPVPYSKLTRFEVRLKKCGRVTELASIKNPFETLEIFRPAHLFSGPRWVTKSFLDSSRARGLKRALALLPPEQAKATAKKIKNSSPSWWDPPKIWAGWPEALEAYGLTEKGLDFVPTHIKNPYEHS